ncbi:MAG: sugar phosphate isomerase/epimerase, partial [Mesorhizobium sp.]|nr:sugar phosphate isomerase/epimerase [Mesorhizobium sp.]
MLKRRQLIGANFSFQHHPFRWTAEKLSAMGFDRMEFWGIAPHLDLFHDNRARLAEVKSILADNGLSVRCFTPEQVLYPINIASGDSAYREASVERFMRAADISAELGATYLFLTPGRGFECESRQTAWEHSVASINRIAAHARSLGVSCLLEPLQRLE